MADFQKVVPVDGEPNVVVGVEFLSDLVDLGIPEFGATVSLYIGESKRLRKALKKAEKRARLNGGC